ncbi:hypothetical protein GT347_10890 [Xylophilus rhododendri]|uniref:Double-GTPase 1 domain-containing protein n=1 Tax=Xylophilus rhododendri TaxID=2697032 RepID=A0A857J6L5_9BURK|nr:hypothetical protein [Xylophilus rhododendri]QHI98455.1 hypothetical protein GT347_10890 [Xylophilus rhododendri]
MESNFVIMGLPASGKSTFLAALWHLVSAGEVKSRLLLDDYDGDLKYLNLIAQAWRTFQKIPRTSQYGGDVNVKIKLLDTHTGSKGVAYFPDLAGEAFDIQVEARQSKPDFVEAVSEDDGILFFIGADLKGDTMSILELNASVPAGASDSVSEISGDQPESDRVGIAQEAEEWSPKAIPAQVRIVQILSDLLCLPFAPRRRRLVIIISAWDLVEARKISPVEWLTECMPLVSQFLRSNEETFRTRIYGVSAQGADLQDADAIKLIAQQPSASRRIRVVGPAETDHDLTAPLVWLLSEE